MTKLLGFVGGVIGSYAGWFLGGLANLMLAFLLSMAGLGIGMYYGAKLGRRYS